MGWPGRPVWAAGPHSDKKPRHPRCGCIGDRIGIVRLAATIVCLSGSR